MCWMMSILMSLVTKSFRRRNRENRGNCVRWFAAAATMCRSGVVGSVAACSVRVVGLVGLVTAYPVRSVLSARSL